MRKRRRGTSKRSSVGALSISLRFQEGRTLIQVSIARRSFCRCWAHHDMPAFANPSAYLETKPSPRQSMFSHFASTLRQLIPTPGQGGPLILLTGGLNSRPLIADSLNSACDLAGIGRAACVVPSFARKMLDPSIPDEEARMVYRIPGGPSTIRILAAGGSGDGIPLIGAGVATLWHEWQMARMGRGLEPDLRMKWGIISVLVEVLWYGLLRWLWAWAVGSRDN